MEVEVVDIRKSLSDGNLKALASIRFGGKLLVQGFSVMNGKNGIFVGMPRKAGKDGRWSDFVVADDVLKRDVEDKVLEAYEREIDGAAN